LDGKDKPKAATASSSSDNQTNAAWMAMSVFPDLDDLFDKSDLPVLAQLPESDDESDDKDLDELSVMFQDESTAKIPLGRSPDLCHLSQKPNVDLSTQEYNPI
jgi:hypothetical protein